jgi:hypothetical protein
MQLKCALHVCPGSAYAASLSLASPLWGVDLSRGAARSLLQNATLVLSADEVSWAGACASASISFC